MPRRWQPGKVGAQAAVSAVRLGPRRRPRMGGGGGEGAAKPKGGAKPTLPVPGEGRWGKFHGGARAAVNQRNPEEARELWRA